MQDSFFQLFKENPQTYPQLLWITIARANVKIESALFARRATRSRVAHIALRCELAAVRRFG